jgi:hypothetical protein
MRRSFRTAAVHLALVAMLLRALLPAGWMPSTVAGPSFLVICSMDAPVQHGDQHGQGQHTPDDGQHSHDECPFAAAPHIAPAGAVAQLAQPSYFGRFSNPPGVAQADAKFSLYQPQSPRAPPLTG